MRALLVAPEIEKLIAQAISDSQLSLYIALSCEMFCTMMLQKIPRERIVARADKKLSLGSEMFGNSSIRQCTGTGSRPLCTRSAWR